MQITSEVIAHSKIQDSPVKTEILTFEWTYPRIIHSEFMTHRSFTRNSASSRAIPINKMIEHIRENTAHPASWGSNKPGMQAGEECFNLINGHTREDWWNMACEIMIHYAEGYYKNGYHKQIGNRLIEPFTHMKTVVTATTYDNFFWLRFDEAADPTIHLLAAVALASYKDSQAIELKHGDWHTPYYKNGFWRDSGNGTDVYGNSLATALKISSSCCAQVSYRKNDDSEEKAEDIYGKLINGSKVHASPFEHQATPMQYPTLQSCQIKNDFELFDGWVDGVTHITKNGDFCSGNFKHWIQHRQLIVGHQCEEFDYNQ
jgi:hypothetical protein